MSVKIKTNIPEIWKPFYEAKWDKAILIGGRSFGKTWVGSDFLVRKIIENPYFKAQVFRDTDKQINTSILAAIKKRFYQIAESFQRNGWDLFEFFDVQDTKIRFTNPTNGEIVNNLTKKGFKKYKNEKVATQKGDEDIALQIFEELQDITNEEEVNIALNTAKAKNKKAIFILNTPDLEHWIVKRYFDYEFVEEVEAERFYKLIPKKSKTDKILSVFGTYKDNEFVSEAVKKEYESYINPNSLEYNKYYYYKHILGYATEALNKLRLFDTRQVQNLQIKKPITSFLGVDIYKEPQIGKHYSIGVDPSSGLGKDFTAITIREVSLGLPLLAQYKGKLNEENTASTVLALFSKIKEAGANALITVELNNMGIAVQNRLNDYLDPVDFYQRFEKQDFSQLLAEGKVGWKTTGGNRSIIINNFSRLFAKSEIEICSEYEKKEMMEFVFNDKKQRYEASEGNNDDVILSDCICLQGVDFITKFV